MAETKSASSDGRAILDVTPRVNYDVRSDGPVPLIKVAGELDLLNADTLARCLSVFQPGDAVILDLSLLAYIDSSGINVLAQTYARGVNIMGRGAHGLVRRALEICGLDGVLLASEH